MSEVYFYHLQKQPLDEVLPKLLGLTLGRGWRALVRVASQERLAALDDHLWSFSDESFLPHGGEQDGDPSGQPVLLTQGEVNRNGAAALVLVEGAAVPDDISGYRRVMYLLDGRDESAVAAGRAAYRSLKEAGHDLSYWQQDEGGRWARKG